MDEAILCGEGSEKGKTAADSYARISQRLHQMQDEAYRSFTSALIPTVRKDKFIGIRTPMLRSYAKELKNTADAEAFLRRLPHEFYEENLLHAFLIEQIRDYDECIRELDRFLPYVDNWAVCDCMSPKVLKKHPQSLLRKSAQWMQELHPYTVRFGIKQRMNWFLDELFLPEQAEAVAAVRSEEYYVNLMIAWYFATALAKQYDAVIPYLQENRLSKWVHNKTIQKAVESNRITPEQKDKLRSLRRK